MRPLWKVVELVDLEEDVRRLWVAKTPNECPGVVIGQFFERGQDAYAIVFYSRRKTGSREKLVILRVRKEQIESHTAHEGKASPGERIPVIWRLGPGKYASGDGSKEIQITQDAVALELAEGVILYYWNGGRFQKLILTE